MRTRLDAVDRGRRARGAILRSLRRCRTSFIFISLLPANFAPIVAVSRSGHATRVGGSYFPIQTHARHPHARQPKLTKSLLCRKVATAPPQTLRISRPSPIRTPGTRSTIAHTHELRFANAISRRSFGLLDPTVTDYAHAICTPGRAQSGTSTCTCAAHTISSHLHSGRPSIATLSQYLLLLREAAVSRMRAVIGLGCECRDA